MPPHAYVVPHTPQPAPKKRNTALIVVLVVAGVLCLLCVGGLSLVAFTARDAVKVIPVVMPSPTPTRPDYTFSPTPQATRTPTYTAPTTLTLGDEAGLTKADGTVATIKLSNARNGKGEYDSHNYVIVTVEITCTAVSLSYNPFDFKLKDADGVEHSPGFFSGANDSLHAGDLPAGQKVKGSVAFQAPLSALHGSMVEFAPGFTTIAYWTLP